MAYLLKLMKEENFFAHFANCVAIMNIIKINKYVNKTLRPLRLNK